MNNNFCEGIIVKLTGGNYYVKTDTKLIYKCRARGKFRNDNISPLVGDKVVFEITEHQEGYIQEVKTRDNELTRPKVANVDFGLIVTSVCEPRLNLFLLDKLIVSVEINNIIPVLLFTKVDLLEDSSEFDDVFSYYRSLGYAVFTSNSIHEYDKSIVNLLNDKTTILVGQTGVGKSTFINNLDSSLELETAAISKALGRGKHTTRHTEIFYINNIRIVDSPGFSALDLPSSLSELEIANCFVEFYNLKEQCKYATCVHINEPKCNVKDNLDNIHIQTRYENYLKIVSEVKTLKR